MNFVSSETIREVWRSHVWANPVITDYTEVIVEHDLSEEFHQEVAKIRHNQQINFFAFRVRRSFLPLLHEKIRLLFFINVSYTRWADPQGRNYNIVLDGIETMQELVVTELGSTWGGVVHAWSPQEGPPVIQVGRIADDVIYRADFNFEALVADVDIAEIDHGASTSARQFILAG